MFLKASGGNSFNFSYIFYDVGSGQNHIAKVVQTMGYGELRHNLFQLFQWLKCSRHLISLNTYISKYLLF